MRKLLRKAWQKIKSNPGKIIGGMIGGVIGSVIGTVIDHIIIDNGRLSSEDIQVSANVEYKFNNWIEYVFEPYFLNSLKFIDTDEVNDLTTDKHMSDYNKLLLQLRSWQSYHEAAALSSVVTDEDKELHLIKSIMLYDSIKVFTEAWKKTGVDTPFYFGLKTYDPVVVREVAGEKLDWSKIGVKNIKSNGIFLTDGVKIPQSLDVLQVFEKSGLTPPSEIVAVVEDNKKFENSNNITKALPTVKPQDNKDFASNNNNNNIINTGKINTSNTPKQAGFGLLPAVIIAAAGYGVYKSQTGKKKK